MLLFGFYRAKAGELRYFNDIVENIARCIIERLQNDCRVT